MRDLPKEDSEGFGGCRGDKFIPVPGLLPKLQGSAHSGSFSFSILCTLGVTIQGYFEMDSFNFKPSLSPEKIICKAFPGCCIFKACELVKFIFAA